MKLKRLGRQYVMPRFHGVCWHEDHRNCAVIAPIPFNILFGMSHRLMSWLRYGWSQHYWDPHEAYKRGREEERALQEGKRCVTRSPQIDNITTHELMQDAADKMKQIDEQREQICMAFIAETGLSPSQCEQVLEYGENEVLWYIRKRGDA